MSNWAAKELEVEIQKVMEGEDSDSSISIEDAHYSSSEEEILEENNQNIVDSSSDDEIVTQHAEKRRICSETIAELVWKSSADNFTPTFDFDQNIPGVTQSFTLNEDALEVEYILHFFDEKLLNILTAETNRYADQTKNQRKMNFSWQNVNNNEMYRFIAANILMGLVEKNAMRDYWSTRKSIATPFFSKIFSRDRFLSIMCNLHFVNNEELM